ncbi:MAG: hypothetical protein HOQ35_08275 [Acidobacteriaceae bacterium]|nr:hypothetical protein [Acidobacteriaceae bacterium]
MHLSVAAWLQSTEDGDVMQQFQLLAQPLWVNTLVLIPLVLFFSCRSRGLQISGRKLLVTAIFALAFGFVEAAVVVYLRAATGLLPGYSGALSQIQQTAEMAHLGIATIGHFPHTLLTIEMVREAATIVMLVSIASLTGARPIEQWAVFQWTFAIWDISYYAGLWATIRWPTSLKDLDILFLIPVPWLAQVWYPLLLSTLTLIIVGVSRKESRLV